MTLSATLQPLAYVIQMCVQLLSRCVVSSVHPLYVYDLVSTLSAIWGMLLCVNVNPHAPVDLLH